MVRVGGGWVALDEFLVKNDPCRGKEADKKFLYDAVILDYSSCCISTIGILNQRNGLALVSQLRPISCSDFTNRL